MRWPQTVHDVSAVLHAVASCALGTASILLYIKGAEKNLSEICTPFRRPDLFLRLPGATH